MVGRVARFKSGIGIALLAGAVAFGASGCGGSASATSAKGSASPVAGGASASTSASASPSASPSPTHPAGPPLQLDTIYPLDGETVGVAQPISIVFTHSVASSARKAVEQALKVTTSSPMTGAWHWFSSTRVDWRPQSYWPSGTKVSVNADLNNVGDGNGRWGTHDYHHSFTIGADVEAKVDAPGHSMKVYKNGSLIKSMPIDAGSPTFPSWDGTMAVIDKQAEVRMTSCSVGISCDKSSPNYYDITLPWDVHLTTSGTYVHYSTGDPWPGHSYGSHGCVHLSLSDSEWFYNLVQPGDPVTITGSPRGNTPGDNGYAAFTLSWSDWLSGSAAGELPTTVG
ncbi:L,D-transpeptidase [Streptacidiphilus jiangxiensis]|uniref:Lipoprotein-anchoring transpeptidase ErfK/SrfK n=1 Tax=Streptacidiphilus jiangxiensis TaxID=235985 RepID=A0A1H7JS23_STRJI|nr:L,D-transpeptidase [Streptacidiphilus jiangxiensis]SEK77399.1 Lipoprotein-anchoring transpeptidase ErfK/SrfK [Streptacidiphilus jiangxiensis]